MNGLVVIAAGDFLLVLCKPSSAAEGDELAKISLFDRGYRHKDLADDVTVLIETTAGEPQTWVRTKLRSVYTVHDPNDIMNHEAVRVMLTRALFWAAQMDEAKFRK